MSELEVKHRDSMIQMQHRGEVITQLREEVDRLKSLVGHVIPGAVPGGRLGPL